MSNSSIITFSFWPWWASFVRGAWGALFGVGVGVITWINDNTGAGLFLLLLLLLLLPRLPLLIRHLIIGCLYFTLFSIILVLFFFILVGWPCTLVISFFITQITFSALINRILGLLLITWHLDLSGRLSPLNGEPSSDTNWKDLKMPRGGWIGNLQLKDT